MTEFNQLESLWQQQQVTLPSNEALLSRWKRQRIKQWAMALLDVLAGLMSIAVIWHFKDQSMHAWVKLWVFGFAGLGIAVTPYMLWLRRMSFRSIDLSTQDYLIHLQQQCANNIKIARLTQGFILFTLLLCIPWQGYYWWSVQGGEIALSKFLFINGFLLVWLGGFWVWAVKHKDKYRRELASLSKLKNEV